MKEFNNNYSILTGVATLDNYATVDKMDECLSKINHRIDTSNYVIKTYVNKVSSLNELIMKEQELLNKRIQKLREDYDFLTDYFSSDLDNFMQLNMSFQRQLLLAQQTIDTLLIEKSLLEDMGWFKRLFKKNRLKAQEKAAEITKNLYSSKLKEIEDLAANHLKTMQKTKG